MCVAFSQNDQSHKSVDCGVGKHKKRLLLHLKTGNRKEYQAKMDFVIKKMCIVNK